MDIKDRLVSRSALISMIAMAAAGILPLALAAENQPLGVRIDSAEEKRLQDTYEAYRNVDPDYVHAGEAALDRWMDWKWGLRIHWGLYSMWEGSDASWIIQQHAGDKEWQKNYFASYQQFNPTNFNANEWMEIIQRAGMKYFSFTSKHHEGFCMWPTKTLQKGFRKKADGTFEEVVDHYSIAETPFKRDIIGELVKAGRAHGLGVSLYYSHIDWHDWDFGWDNQCGPNFWYDGTFTKKSDDPKRWAAFIQKERDQIAELLTQYGPIDTLCLDISWCKEAQEWILESLIDIVAKGGNFQAGFGPGPDGKWQEEMIDRIRYVGDWLKVNGECIFATRPYLRYHEGNDLRFTRTKDRKYVYIIALKWPGETLRSKVIKAKEGSVIRMIGLDQDLKWRQDGETLVIDLPRELQDETKRPCKQAYAFKVNAQAW